MTSRQEALLWEMDKAINEIRNKLEHLEYIQSTFFEIFNKEDIPNET